MQLAILNMTEKAKASKEGKAVIGIDNSTDLWNDVLIERWSEDADLQKWNYVIRPHVEGKMVQLPVYLFGILTLS